MAPVNREVTEALSLIENAKLPHPSASLLALFVSEALNPVLAARYAKYRLLAGEASSLVDDWSYIIESISHDSRPPPRPHITQEHTIAKRDGERCCITGKAGTSHDPLIVAPILPVPSGWDTDKDNINDMLGAFFGPPYRDWWLSYIRNPQGMMPEFSHWLVRKSAAKAFASGLIKLDRLQPSMIEYKLEQVAIGLEEPIQVDGDYPLLGDHSRSGFAKVDPRFVGTHARLCKSIQYLNLSKKFSRETPSQSSSLPIGVLSRNSNIGLRDRWGLSSFCARVFLRVWLLVPAKARMACYKILRRLGKRLYGRTDDYTTVQRLPFGLFLKYNAESQ